MLSIKALLLALTMLLVAQPVAAEWTLLSQNLNRLFDDRDDPGDDQVMDKTRYRERVEQLARRIVETFDQPDVLAFQEVENWRILQAVARAVEQLGGRSYRALLIEGNDRSGMDVGFLLAEDLKLQRLEALFADERYRYEHDGETIVAPLYARPPLLLEFCREDCFSLVNVHLRSMRGLRHRSKGRRIALKRQLQAETLARWVQDFQQSRPDQPLALVGDFNALTPSDRFVDVIGTLIGRPDHTRPKRKSPDLVEPDLVEGSTHIRAGRSYSYRYKRRKQRLDYLLMNRSADALLEHIAYGWIDYGFSDHGALSARFLQP